MDLIAAAASAPDSILIEPYTTWLLWEVRA
jgi:hypothetical protein